MRVHRQLCQTILFVTHDIDEAVRLADTIVVTRTGQIVQTGTPLEIVTTQRTNSSAISSAVEMHCDGLA